MYLDLPKLAPKVVSKILISIGISNFTSNYFNFLALHGITQGYSRPNVIGMHFNLADLVSTVSSCISFCNFE